jgi:hypothetical protein
MWHGLASEMEYRSTQSIPAARLQADRVTDDFSHREAALRKLPVPYSLALRLRKAGVARQVICEYVGVEDSSLDGVYRIAEEKLVALQKRHGVSRGSDSHAGIG